MCMLFCNTYVCFIVNAGVRIMFALKAIFVVLLGYLVPAEGVIVDDVMRLG